VSQWKQFGTAVSSSFLRRDHMYELRMFQMKIWCLPSPAGRREAPVLQEQQMSCPQTVFSMASSLHTSRMYFWRAVIYQHPRNGVSNVQVLAFKRILGTLLKELGFLLPLSPAWKALHTFWTVEVNQSNSHG